MEKSNPKPFFFFFFMNLGLKEPYLVYWWCLTVLDYIGVVLVWFCG